MTTAIIGTGTIGSTVARDLASGGEDVRLANASPEPAKTLAAEIGDRAVAEASNRDAVAASDSVVFSLWLAPIKAAIDEVADLLPGKLVVETTNPISVDAQGQVSRTLPEGQSSGELVATWMPAGVHFAKAFNTLSAELLASSANRQPKRAVLFYATDDDEAASRVERLINVAGFDPVRVGGVASSGRIEVGGELHPFGGLEGKLLDVEEAQTLL
jgi:8-hydroxy-5-deazaflavin:NADPH oxidoreductase